MHAIQPQDELKLNEVNKAHEICLAMCLCLDGRIRPDMVKYRIKSIACLLQNNW